MSDLISRSDLLNAFNNKELEIIYKIPVDIDTVRIVHHAISIHKNLVIDIIKNQPTCEKKIDGVNGGWIPVSERLPEPDQYILVSFSNFSLPDIGRYEQDADGNGAFYPGDDDRSYSSINVFVNAWMSLPEAYKESDD